MDIQQQVVHPSLSGGGLLADTAKHTSTYTASARHMHHHNDVPIPMRHQCEYAGGQGLNTVDAESFFRQQQAQRIQRMLLEGDDADDEGRRPQQRGGGTDQKSEDDNREAIDDYDNDVGHPTPKTHVDNAGEGGEGAKSLSPFVIHQPDDVPAAAAHGYHHYHSATSRRRRSRPIVFASMKRERDEAFPYPPPFPSNGGVNAVTEASCSFPQQQQQQQQQVSPSPAVGPMPSPPIRPSAPGIVVVDGVPIPASTPLASSSFGTNNNNNPKSVPLLNNNRNPTGSAASYHSSFIAVGPRPSLACAGSFNLQSPTEENRDAHADALPSCSVETMLKKLRTENMKLFEEVRYFHHDCQSGGPLLLNPESREGKGEGVIRDAAQGCRLSIAVAGEGGTNGAREEEDGAGGGLCSARQMAMSESRQQSSSCSRAKSTSSLPSTVRAPRRLPRGMRRGGCTTADGGGGGRGLSKSASASSSNRSTPKMRAVGSSNGGVAAAAGAANGFGAQFKKSGPNGIGLRCGSRVASFFSSNDTTVVATSTSSSISGEMSSPLRRIPSANACDAVSALLLHQPSSGSNRGSAAINAPVSATTFLTDGPAIFREILVAAGLTNNGITSGSGGEEEDDDIDEGREAYGDIEANNLASKDSECSGKARRIAGQETVAELGDADRPLGIGGDPSSTAPPFHCPSFSLPPAASGHGSRGRQSSRKKHSHHHQHQQRSLPCTRELQHGGLHTPKGELGSSLPLSPEGSNVIVRDEFCELEKGFGFLTPRSATSVVGVTFSFQSSALLKVNGGRWGSAGGINRTCDHSLLFPPPTTGTFGKRQHKISGSCGSPSLSGDDLTILLFAVVRCSGPNERSLSALLERGISADHIVDVLKTFKGCGGSRTLADLVQFLRESLVYSYVTTGARRRRVRDEHVAIDHLRKESSAMCAIGKRGRELVLVAPSKTAGAQRHTQQHIVPSAAGSTSHDGPYAWPSVGGIGGAHPSQQHQGQEGLSHPSTANSRAQEHGAPTVCGSLGARAGLARGRGVDGGDDHADNVDDHTLGNAEARRDNGGGNVSACESPSSPTSPTPPYHSPPSRRSPPFNNRDEDDDEEDNNNNDCAEVQAESTVAAVLGGQLHASKTYSNNNDNCPTLPIVAAAVPPRCEEDDEPSEVISLSTGVGATLPKSGAEALEVLTMEGKTLGNSCSQRWGSGSYGNCRHDGGRGGTAGTRVDVHLVDNNGRQAGGGGVVFPVGRGGARYEGQGEQSTEEGTSLSSLQCRRGLASKGTCGRETRKSTPVTEQQQQQQDGYEGGGEEDEDFEDGATRLGSRAKRGEAGADGPAGEYADGDDVNNQKNNYVAPVVSPSWGVPRATPPFSSAATSSSVPASLLYGSACDNVASCSSSPLSSSFRADPPSLFTFDAYWSFLFHYLVWSSRGHQNIAFARTISVECAIAALRSALRPLAPPYADALCEFLAAAGSLSPNGGTPICGRSSSDFPSVGGVSSSPAVPLFGSSIWPQRQQRPQQTAAAGGYLFRQHQGVNKSQQQEPPSETLSSTYFVPTPMRHINHDQWCSIIHFGQVTEYPMMAHYSAEDSWPVLLDEFVEWSKGLRGVRR